MKMCSTPNTDHIRSQPQPQLFFRPSSLNVISSLGLSIIWKKVNDIVRITIMDPGVHNGHRKIYAESEMFMTGENISGCVNSLKFKNVEGNVKNLTK